MDTSEVITNILAHTGVKGMKWGVRRKATVGPQEVIVRDSRFPLSKRQVAKGGGGHAAVSEATTSRAIGRVGQKSGTKALTNKQLEEYNKRLNLEQNFHRLSYADKNAGQKMVAVLLRQTGNTSAQRASNYAVTEAGKKALALAAAA
jgi:hypothetical protein